MEAIDAGEVEYDFVEVMACPGGCAGGGGQPIHDSCGDGSQPRRRAVEYRQEYKGALLHENKDVQALYKEYLRQPLGHKAHMLLHTDHFGWKMPSGH